MRISLTRKTLNIEFVSIKESFTNMIIFEASNEKGTFFPNQNGLDLGEAYLETKHFAVFQNEENEAYGKI